MVPDLLVICYDLLLIYVVGGQLHTQFTVRFDSIRQFRYVCLLIILFAFGDPTVVGPSFVYVTVTEGDTFLLLIYNLLPLPTDSLITTIPGVVTSGLLFTYGLRYVIVPDIPCLMRLPVIPRCVTFTLSRYHTGQFPFQAEFTDLLGVECDSRCSCCEPVTIFILRCC